MNLVAKEYIASCIDKGVLILSELTGAASELNEAFLVNPTDTDEVAAAIASGAYHAIDRTTFTPIVYEKALIRLQVVRWVNDFLEELKRIERQEQEQLKVRYTG